MHRVLKDAMYLVLLYCLLKKYCVFVVVVVLFFLYKNVMSFG